MAKILFLPGAGGSAGFWCPVAERLAERQNHPALSASAVFLSWPGLGAEPTEPQIQGLDDLVSRTCAHMDKPVDLVAQSMGGLVALKAALKRPHLVRRMVLVATSGGVPAADLGGADWRSDYYTAFPHAARWIGEAHEDISPQLGKITMPVLLLWGNADPISPPAIGQRLQHLLPNARLHVISGGDHDLAQTHAGPVAALIGAHLADAGWQASIDLQEAMEG
ncbi:alpha/beta fold hydrolase [Xanthobacter sp. TB0139]|uniref:alpha/beta fold hydrolase n=1 Tax=Xanthobacter sp. TB0139 TaxID=3459178 RepID=UPI00403A53E7